MQVLGSAPDLIRSSCHRVGVLMIVLMEYRYCLLHFSLACGCLCIQCYIYHGRQFLLKRFQHHCCNNEAMRSCKVDQYGRLYGSRLELYVVLESDWKPSMLRQSV